MEWSTGHIYRLLNNRVYIGEIAHKEKIYPGEHEGIIERKTWEKVQAILSDGTRDKQSIARTRTIAPLRGVIRCGHCGCAMGPTYTRKKDRLYTYYICEKNAKRAVSTCSLKRLPAGDIEKAVIEQLSAVFRTPTLVAKTYLAARDIETAERDRLLSRKAQLERDLSNIRTQVDGDATHADRVGELSRQLADVTSHCQAFEGTNITERDVSESFQSVESFWEDLFPMERNRLVRLLVEKVEVRETGIDMELKTSGMTTLVTELAGLGNEETERRESR